jgi:hypothetical protein
MPLLVEHFIEHRQENSHLNVWQFLYMHYAMGDVHDADHAKDVKLPFKSHDNCVASTINVYLPSCQTSGSRQKFVNHTLIRSCSNKNVCWNGIYFSLKRLIAKNYA